MENVSTVNTARGASRTPATAAMKAPRVQLTLEIDPGVHPDQAGHLPVLGGRAGGEPEAGGAQEDLQPGHQAEGGQEDGDLLRRRHRVADVDPAA